MLARTIATIAHNTDEDKRVSLIMFSNHAEGWFWVEDEDHNHLFDCKGYIDAVSTIERLYSFAEWDLQIVDQGEES